MNVALWAVAGVLAVVFLVSGTIKVFVPQANLDALLERAGGAAEAAGAWTRDFSPGFLKTIGVLELSGAAGLILPAALDIAPILVPLAASGAVLLFVGAVIMRLRRGERATIAIDLLYLALAAFVASGRFGPWSFTS
jgi:DoxX-like family